MLLSQFAVIFTLFASFGLASFAEAAPKQEPLPVPRYDFTPVTNRVQGWVDKGYYPGASLIVVKDGQVVYDRQFGNYTPDTVQFLASSGKWLGAATIASIVDTGKLSWDDPVSKWLPQFTGDMGRATLRQLLSHTSGFPNYQPKGNPDDNYETLAESVDHIVPLSPTAKPGAIFDYGGLAMQTAGRMAELASGKDWVQLFDDNIAGPLGMYHTYFRPVDPGHIPMIAGGARGTVGDYINFLSMIAGDGVFKGRRILSPAAIHEMEADQVRGAAVRPGTEYTERERGVTHNGVYGLGEWREQLDSHGDAVLLSSPGWAGEYPWIDKTRNLYGFLLTHVVGGPAARDKFSSFYESPTIAIAVREVIDQGPNPAPVAHGFMNVGGAKLYYESSGTGPDVILLHAHSLDLREWDPQFYQLAKHYHVIRYDLRGYGQSDMPTEGVPYTHAGDLLALMNALQIKKANLVGVSLGALTAIDFLSMHPERVQSIAIAGGAIHDSASSPNETDQQRAAAEAQYQADQLKKVADFNSQGIDSFKRTWLASLMGASGPRKEEIRPLVWEMLKDWSAWQPSHIEAHALLNTSVAPVIAQEKPTVPILVFTSDHDWPGSTKSMEALLAIDPHAHRVNLTSGGHLSNMDDAPEFNEHLEEFLAKTNP